MFLQHLQDADEIVNEAKIKFILLHFIIFAAKLVSELNKIGKLVSIDDKRTGEIWDHLPMLPKLLTCILSAMKLESYYNLKWGEKFEL